MDFIIDEAEISDGSYSELSDREDELSSADDFIESDNDKMRLSIGDLITLLKIK